MSVVVDCRVAARDLDVDVAFPLGRTVALVGSNGAGKSTILQLLAGLVQPDQGRVAVAGRTLASVGVPGARDESLPPHRRNVALLEQRPLLFPHMDVTANVAFGPRSRGTERAAAERVAERWLLEVDAAEFASRRPAQLSGGQAQRIALARALAAEPEILLLDEPLAALDVAAVPAVRQTLRRILAGRTAIIVTHDVLDAVLLADRIAVLEHGRIVEWGETAAVVRTPRSTFAAQFCGLNLMRGMAVDAEALRCDDDLVVSGQAEPLLRPGRPAVAVFSPAAVSVHLSLPSGSPRNAFAVAVDAIEPQRHLVRIRGGGLSADITPAAVAELRLATGDRVHFAVKAAEVRLYEDGRED